MKRFKMILALLIFSVTIPYSLFSTRINTDTSADTLTKIASYPLTQLTNNVSVRMDTQSNLTKNKGHYIIELKNGISASDKQTYLSKYGVSEDLLDNGKISTNLILTNNIQSLADGKYVQRIEEDSTLLTESVNDPSYSSQWYLPAISYESMLGNQNKNQEVVAVVDSGSCINHPDLVGRYVAGWNFVDNNSDTSDSLGHGCEVSGVIAANTNNNIGIAGSSLNTMIMPLKVIGSDGTGSYSNLINAIDYAVSKKVNIINISLGGYYDSDILHEAIQKAKNAGIVVVASAGNTGNNTIMYPAIYPEVISVGSVENDYSISTYSSNSSIISLWAFGSSVLTTTTDGNYSTESGTSLATAEVSAFIAEGGQYKVGGIINYLSTDKKPVFVTNPVSEQEPNSKLSFTVPGGLSIIDFSNASANTDTLINWEKTIHLSRTESLVITVWNRSKIIDTLISDVREQDNCPISNDFCLVNYPKIEGDYSYYLIYFKQGNSLIRLRYNIDDLVGYKNFKLILNSIKINNKSIDYQNLINNIESKVKFPTVIIPQSEATCGYDSNNNLFTDPLNEFNCCHPDSSGNYNFGNCTWYAEYKRHDLIGVVTNLNAGDWYQAAVNHGLPTSTTTPVIGAIAVWSGHVAYIEDVNTVTHTMTWSEENCNTYWIDGQGVKHYGVNAYNPAVTQPYPNTYGGIFYGYILPSGCSGNNPIMQNWNVGGPLTCTPTGTLTVKPESHILNGVTIKSN